MPQCNIFILTLEHDLVCSNSNGSENPAAVETYAKIWSYDFSSTQLQHFSLLRRSKAQMCG